MRVFGFLNSCFKVSPEGFLTVRDLLGREMRDSKAHARSNTDLGEVLFCDILGLLCFLQRNSQRFVPFLVPVGSITSRCSGNEAALTPRRGSKTGHKKTAEIEPIVPVNKRKTNKTKLETEAENTNLQTVRKLPL